MRILGLTTSYPLSATDDSSVFIHRLYRAMAKIAQVSIAAPAADNGETTEDRDGVTIRWYRYLPFGSPKLVYGAGLLPNLKRYPWRAFELPLLVLRLAVIAIRERAAYDVLHANWILAGLAARIAHLFTGKPYVVTLRGSDTMLFTLAPVRWISGLALRKSLAVTAVSEQMRVETVAAFPWIERKIVCIENGVEQDEAAGGGALPELPKRFAIAVGTVIPRKRIDKAIEILSRPALSDLSLVVCGRTGDAEYFERLKAGAESLGISKRVLFTGPLPPALIWAALRRASLFLTCSSYEGRPNAVLEALCCGVPVAASAIPAHSAILEDNQSAILFDPEDAEGAAARIGSLLSDSELLGRMVAAGKEIVKDASWGRCAGRYIEIFKPAVKAPL